MTHFDKWTSSQIASFRSQVDHMLPELMHLRRELADYLHVVAHASTMPQAMVNGGMDWADKAVAITKDISAIRDKMKAVANSVDMEGQ